MNEIPQIECKAFPDEAQPRLNISRTHGRDNSIDCSSTHHCGGRVPPIAAHQSAFWKTAAADCRSCVVGSISLPLSDSLCAVALSRRSVANDCSALFINACAATRESHTDRVKSEKKHQTE
jgi:hypothetical protein